MPKHKFGFWLAFVLVLGLCANLLASDKDVPLQHKLKWLKNSPLFQKEARTLLPPHLWTSQKTQNFTKVVNGTGAISGLVYQASRGVPIEGVEITADQLIVCPAYSASAYSDDNGYYIIEGLPPGKYVVSTDNDSDFVNIYWDDEPIEEMADTVGVASNDTAKGIDFSLRVGGKVTGTLTLSGAPLVTGAIYAIDTTYRQAYVASVYGMGDSAPYEIKRLPTGIYKLMTMNMMGYIDVYYNDKSSWATASRLSVGEGGTNPGINFTLSLGGSIEGNISSTVKALLEDIIVLGYYASDPSEWFTLGITDADGNYSLIGLRSGYWKLFAYGDTMYAFEWYDDKDTWAVADSVLVTAPGTIPGKDFTLEVGGSISGHVYDLEGFPLSGCDVMAFHGSFSQWGMVTIPKGNTTSFDGSYKIGGLRTGDYIVVASTETECYEIWYDNQTSPATASLVHVTMPSDHSGIDFNLPTAVETEDELAQRPAEFELHQNYPNPFNPVTRIEYTIKKRGHVALRIYNILGERVRTLLDQDQLAGFYQINWDGENDKGKAVSSGLYLYKLEVNGFSQAKRMLLLK